MPGKAGASPPDTPGSEPSTPRRPGEGPRERNVFRLDSDAADGSPSHSEAAQQGFDRPDQTVFDLTMDYSDDETLLDWEQYAGMRRFRCWGLDCSLVARFCPWLPWVPPEWYYRYSRKQRRLMAAGAAIFGGLLLLVVGATVLVSLLPRQDKPSGLGFADEECGWASYKLPSSLRPSSYDLDLSVQLEAPFLVSGSVLLAANLTKPSRCLVLHALGMNVTAAARTDVPANASWRFNAREQLVLQFPKPLQPGAVSVRLAFAYTLSEGLSGFYRSSYTDAGGSVRQLATTQMEANSARKAFPCLDEPRFKAVWRVSITAPAGQTVLANMPLASSRAQSGGGGGVRHSFQPTPPMASYLVAFIVGNLSRVSADVPAPAGQGPPRTVSVYGTPDREQQLQTALEIATTVLPAYESLFGVPYALPKLDLVAIPDFAAGAMENWGLITYRETALLSSANDSSVANERRVAVVIAHEMAHLWFGDLVTMRDWGELWLNEGFATYFENVGAAIARPAFAYQATFFADVTAEALAADALPGSTHALATLTGMDTAERVEAMFDSISYEKGGALLRMLRAYLGRGQADVPWLRRRGLLQEQQQQGQQGQGQQPEAFLRGLQAYLQARALNSSTSADLWAALDAATGEPVSGWMQRWTFQPGVPRVQALLGGPLNREVTIYQAPFEVGGSRRCEAGPKGAKTNSNPWWVPVAAVSRDARAPVWTTFDGCLLDRPIHTLQDDSDWVKLNAGQTGLYRVNYPLSIWRNLAAAAGSPPQAGQAPAISAEDLAGLLDDAWALAQAGETPIAHFLQLTQSLARRTGAELAPWEVAAGNLVSTYHGLQLAREQAGCADRWAAFVRTNVTGAFLSRNAGLALNATDTGGGSAAPDVQGRLLRTLLLGLAAEFGDAGVQQQALALFANASALQRDVDSRKAVYSIVARSGRQQDYDAIKRIYLQAGEPDEKSRALTALAYARQPALVAQTLEFSLSPDVRSQDTAALVETVALRGGASLQAAWDFVRTRYDDLSAKFGGMREAGNSMGKLLRSVASGLADEESIWEIDEVFAQHSQVLTEPRLREGAKEDVRANMDWLRRNAGPVCEWLGQQ